MNGEDLEVLSEDVSKLESQERKLLAELEEEGEEYIDRDLWVRVVSGGKRKLEATDNEVKVLEADKEVWQRPKKQRLITDFHKKGDRVLVDQ